MFSHVFPCFRSIFSITSPRGVSGLLGDRDSTAGVEDRRGGLGGRGPPWSHGSAEDPTHAARKICHCQGLCELNGG